MQATGAPDALSTLRRAIAGHEALPDNAAPFPLGAAPVDAALGGGLSPGTLHEIAPATPNHIAAASGFGLAMAARASSRKAIVLIQTDFAGQEAGLPYGSGLDLFGLDMRRLVVARVARAADALFIMEDALRCRGVAFALCELTGAGEAADITATRRLSLAAREGGGIGFLLRHRASRSPSAAATRWDIAAATGARDRYGGLGATAFLLSLVKNRRGPCGRWTLQWNHHDRIFTAPHSLGLAATPADRPDRAGFARAG